MRRGADGALSALAGRGSSFELARWLEHDGDSRPPTEVGKGRAFRCDAEGCATRVKGLTLAVPIAASALRDDCASAAILVLRIERPRGCAPQATIIDTGDLGRHGAHALYIDAARVRI